MRSAAATAVARAAALASRAAGRGATSLPGKVLLKLDPDALSRLAAPLRTRIVLSATNGKTTTAAMVASILGRTGVDLIHNRAGANMAGGVATALLRADGDTALLEVDEFWLPTVAGQVVPDALLLSNLFRDQLDRYGELEAIADRWAGVVAALPASSALVLNADDPMVADIGRDRDGVVYFGVEDPAIALDEIQHASDAKNCRVCGAPYVYDAHYLGHLGVYHCDACGARRPQPTVVATGVTLDGVRGAAFTLQSGADQRPVALPLPGLYNVYNALAAAALTTALGVGIDDVVAGLQDTAPAFGRAESLTVGGRELQILLIKNPAGANEVLRTLRLQDGRHDLLAVLNDATADGHDVSWIWDADFETLADRVERVTCAGTRAAEMALRFKYAGVDEPRIVVAAGALRGALDEALAGREGPLYALPTYTAMLELRELLVARGAAKASFQ
jgi:lipid II isoglutaminyl synthase (glutamine-hydrolysing)